MYLTYNSNIQLVPQTYAEFQVLFTRNHHGSYVWIFGQLVMYARYWRVEVYVQKVSLMGFLSFKYFSPMTFYQIEVIVHKAVILTPKTISIEGLFNVCMHRLFDSRWL